jgi:hypothetical protein
MLNKLRDEGGKATFCAYGYVTKYIFILIRVQLPCATSIVLILLSFDLGRGCFIVGDIEEIGKPRLNKV